MNNQIREQLIGYVLGALDEHELRGVEQQIERDPQWRAELAEVQKLLEPLVDSYQEFTPPPDLASKACQFVHQEAERLQVVRPCRAEAILEGGFDPRSRWRLADWVVVGGVCLAAAALFFPAILNSRLTSRIAYCQNNLRELGMALTQFTEATHEHFFPAVATEGNRAFAGIYAPILQDSGLIADANLLVCPDSGCEVQDNIPTLAEIDEARGDRILILQREAGGSYAYTVGYLLNGKHCTPRNQGRSYYAIMADAPSLDWNGPPHGSGVNVLYEDMHVQLIANRDGNQVGRDDPFRNLLGRPEAGLHSDDAVVAISYSPPLLTPMSQKIEK